MLVTGVSAGVGVETARALAARGAAVVGAVRDLGRALAATAHVEADAVGARYCEDCRVAETVEDPAASSGVRAYALDPGRARALWLRSEGMVGERF